MGVSTTRLCNMALSHLGSGKEIGNVDTERSEEARACRIFLEQAVKQTLRDYGWPFAAKIVALGLVSNNPTPNWAYAYQYPADCLQFKKIESGLENDSRYTRVPMKIVSGASGRLILSNQNNAVGEYTFDAQDSNLWPEDFVMAVSFRLAVYIAPRVTGGDPFKMGPQCAQYYLEEIGKAQATSSNEEQVEQDPDSEFIQVRDGGPRDYRRRLNND